MTQLALDLDPPRPRGPRPPWQRMRAWKGGWWESWCTDLELECLDVGSTWTTVCKDGCVCKQEDLHELNLRGTPTVQGRPYRRQARIRRDRCGRARAWRERIIGGEPNRAHPPPPPPLPSTPGYPSLQWFLSHGWEGSRVEVEEVEGYPPIHTLNVEGSYTYEILVNSGRIKREPLKKFTLYHPSGAVLSLKPGAVYEEE